MHSQLFPTEVNFPKLSVAKEQTPSKNYFPQLGSTELHKKNKPNLSN